MRRNAWLVMVTFTALACGPSVQEAPGAADDGKVVSMDGLKSKVPAAWKDEAPSGTMRYLQFVVPKAKDDKDDAELVLFKGLGGGARANLERWKGQWVPPQGKKLDDVAVVKEIEIAGRKAQMLDIEGTYRTAPFDPKHKGKALAGYRMLAVYFDGPENPYQIKLTGPAKTVEQNKKAFEDWLKAFK